MMTACCPALPTNGFWSLAQRLASDCSVQVIMFGICLLAACSLQQHNSTCPVLLSCLARIMQPEELATGCRPKCRVVSFKEVPCQVVAR